jgi:hypothetical protein
VKISSIRVSAASTSSPTPSASASNKS